MSQVSDHQDKTFQRAYLIFLTGPRSGGRHLLGKRQFILGRHPHCDFIPEGDLAARVSGKHAELFVKNDRWYVRDLGSTNGTWLNQHRISEAAIHEGDILMLGQKGPQYQWALDHSDQGLAETLVVDTNQDVVILQGERKKKEKSDEHATLLLNAVKRAREARLTGDGGETAVIMREVLSTVIVRSRKKLKVTIAVLLVILLCLTSFYLVQLQRLSQEKDQIDLQITQIEVDLQNADDPDKINSLIADLDAYQIKAREIQKNILYQIGARDEETDFLEGEIHKLMAEFGAEQYSIPPEFRQKVRVYVRRFTGTDRRNMQRALGPQRANLELIRKTLDEFHLPKDLAFIVLVESGFRMKSRSSAGAVGPWQFVPNTARSLGLKVNRDVDERTDVAKSSKAAGRYLRKLIADFGAGQSFMLALAAYNLGPTKVRRIIRKVENPIKQRDFWYLYRTRAFPEETREYIPKIFAAIIVGRNPQRFGFETSSQATVTGDEQAF